MNDILPEPRVVRFGATIQDGAAREIFGFKRFLQLGIKGYDLISKTI